MAGKAEFKKAVPEFDETFDVVVVGYGFAGGVSAIEAARAGARVLLVEKMPDPGGISICSHGAICSSHQPAKALEYLRATNAGRTRDDVLIAFTQGMADVEAYFRDLAGICDAQIFVRERGGNYPLPGADAFYYTQVEAIPNFDAGQTYPHVRGRPGGPMVFKIIQDNVARLPIEVRLSTSAKSVITDANRQAVGLVIAGADGERRVKARRGVVLACGEFRGQRGDEAAVLADDAGLWRGQSRQHGRRDQNGARTGRPALAHVALSRLLRLPSLRSRLSLCYPNEALS